MSPWPEKQLPSAERDPGRQVDRERHAPTCEREGEPCGEPCHEWRGHRPQFPVDEGDQKCTTPRERPPSIGIVDPDLARKQQRQCCKAAEGDQPEFQDADTIVVAQTRSLQRLDRRGRAGRGTKTACRSPPGGPHDDQKGEIHQRWSHPTHFAVQPVGERGADHDDAQQGCRVTGESRHQQRNAAGRFNRALGGSVRSSLQVNYLSGANGLPAGAKRTDWLTGWRWPLIMCASRYVLCATCWEQRAKCNVLGATCRTCYMPCATCTGSTLGWCYVKHVARGTYHVHVARSTPHVQHVAP